MLATNLNYFSIFCGQKECSSWLGLAPVLLPCNLDLKERSILCCREGHSQGSVALHVQATVQGTQLRLWPLFLLINKPSSSSSAPSRRSYNLFGPHTFWGPTVGYKQDRALILTGGDFAVGNIWQCLKMFLVS